MDWNEVRNHSARLFARSRRAQAVRRTIAFRPWRARQPSSRQNEHRRLTTPCTTLPTQASRHFLPLPWSSFDNLLVKVLSDSSGRLSLMATDLEAVYFESLTPRQLNRRVEDAMGTLAGTSQGQSQSQGVMVGIGEEGERLLKESVDALVAAVGDGSARVEISHEAFEVRLRVLSRIRSSINSWRSPPLIRRSTSSASPSPTASPSASSPPRSPISPRPPSPRTSSTPYSGSAPRCSPSCATPRPTTPSCCSGSSARWMARGRRRGSRGGGRGRGLGALGGRDC